jgi:outer membrane lipoprotein carrier protein
MMNRSLFCTLFLGALLATLTAPAWAASLGDVISALETPFQTKTDKKLRIYDYSADFFQESKIASLDRLQRASGEVEVAFDYQRTDTVPRVKFRWQYEQPTTQEIVSDAKTLWVYLPENNQVIQSNIEMVNRSRQNDPMTFLTGLGNLSRDFSIHWAVPNFDVEGNHVLELTPKRISSLINRMIIVVDRYAVEAYLKPVQDEDQVVPSIQSRPSAQSTPPVPTPPTLGGRNLNFPGYEDGLNGRWFPILSTTVYDPNGNSTTIEFSNLRVNFGISDMSFNFMMPAGVQVVRPTGQEMGF